MFKFYILILAVLLVSSCGQNQEKNSAKQISQPAVEQPQNIVQTSEASLEKFTPFYIYQDKGSNQNHYVPSGFMPDGKCILMSESQQENCHSGSCIKVIYDIACSKENQRWAGVFWQYPANNWGQRKGGFNLTGATKLHFRARGDKGGEQIQEFSVGGIMGTYPDSDSAMIGPVILSSDWREYTIDLRGKDLSYLNGGFSWTTNADVNPESCIFYLDDIRFE